MNITRSDLWDEIKIFGNPNNISYRYSNINELTNELNTLKRVEKAREQEQKRIERIRQRERTLAIENARRETARLERIEREKERKRVEKREGKKTMQSNFVKNDFNQVEQKENLKNVIFGKKLPKNTQVDKPINSSFQTIDFDINLKFILTNKELSNLLPINSKSRISLIVEYKNADGSNYNTTTYLGTALPNSRLDHIIRSYLKYIRQFYQDIIGMKFQILPFTTKTPQLLNMKNGPWMNCLIKTIIYELSGKSRIEPIIKKLQKLNVEYLEDGVNNARIQNIANISSCKIVVNNFLNKVWTAFVPINNIIRYTFICTAHNNHLSSNSEDILKNIESESEFNVARYNKTQIKSPFKKKQVVVWNDNPQPNKDCITIIKHKNILATFTDTQITKRTFDEHLLYPDSFSDGGVAKIKFLKYNNNEPFNIFAEVLLKSKVKAFYQRNDVSVATNHIYDINKAFLSVSQLNNVYYPDAIYKVDMLYSELDLNYYTNGLFLTQGMPNLYGDNWYPIECIKHVYEKWNINPIILEFMTGSSKIDLINPVNEMTKNQFRSFVGKCYTSEAQGSICTTDEQELEQLKYYLQDKVISIEQYLVDSDDEIPDIMFQLNYTLDTNPWCCPIIYVNIVVHQKMILLDKYQELTNAGFKIVNSRVDSLETDKNADEYFSLSAEVGDWKKVKVNPDHDDTPYVSEHNIPERLNPLYNVYDDITISVDVNTVVKHKYTHLAGSAGSGKSFTIKILADIYRTAGFCASQHLTVQNLIKLGMKNARTYLSMFNFRNDQEAEYHPVIIIEEVSLITAEDLIKMMNLLPTSKFIIVGDFSQLEAISNESNHISQSDFVNVINLHKIYKKFYVHTLTKNYRQQNDPAFFNICTSIRNVKDLTYKEMNDLIDILNTRVISIDNPMPKFDTKDDIYIAGINKEVDIINNNYNYDIGSKVIVNKSVTIDKKIIPNGLTGVITGFHSAGKDEDNILIKFKDINDNEHIVKKQFLTLNYAATIHKMQGATYTGNVIINPRSLFAINHLYVAVTRATNFNNIYFTENIKYII